MTRDTPFEDSDDCYHPAVSDDPTWAETSWWSFNVPERGIGGWLHSTHHVNRGTATWRVFVWDPTASDNAKLAYCRIARDVPMPEHPDLRDITFPGGGFTIKMIEPRTTYEISYADDDARFSINLTHTGVHAPRRFTPGEPPAKFSPHFDQLGHVVGELVLAGVAIPIDCYSIRDRTWGPRGGATLAPKTSAATTSDQATGPAPTPPADERSRVKNPGGPLWRQVERERGRGRLEYVFGHAGASTGFLSFVRIADGDSEGWFPLNVGWLLQDGVFEHLDKTRSRMRNYRDPSTGWNTHLEVELTDVTGRTMRGEGFSVSHQSENGAGNNALVRWEFTPAGRETEIGWGEDQDIWHPRHFSRMLRALRATSNRDE